MTLKDLIEAKRAEIETYKKAYDGALARQRGITTTVREQGRDELTKLEQAEYDQLRGEAESAEKRHDAAKKALDELERASADEARIEGEQGDVREQSGQGEQTGAAGGAGERRGYENQHRVAGEKRTYNPEMDKTGGTFLRDLSSLVMDPANFEARDRLAQHMREEKVERGDQLERVQRAAGTGAFAGLTVPQYLVDLYAPSATALRPFADACNKHTLPATGMTLNISRITTGTSVALQATENAAISNTDIDDTLLTVNVQTAAGQQTLSRQAIDRGAGVEDVVMQDLFKRYATVLDSRQINHATTGLSAAATSVAYTDATPTAAELYPKILAATAGAEAALLGLATPDIAVMHSRRWYWLQSQLGSTWPLIQQSGLAAQSGGLAYTQSKYGQGARGVLPSGLTVVVDNNVVTTAGGGTEDEIYVVPSEECHLWEDPSAPLFIRAEQPAAASLGVLLVVYGYFGYTFGRYPAGMQKINGTGNIAPVF